MISALIEVTPYPPATDDIDELLAAAADMVRARDSLLAKLPVERGDTSLLVELDARQAAWQIALAAALSRLGSQRLGARRVRAYASYR